MKYVDNPHRQFWEERSREISSMRMPSMTELMDLIHQLSTVDEPGFLQMLPGAPTETDQRLIIGWRQWGRHGYQSVQMPETYAAGLMATDSKNIAKLFDGVDLPWPAFEIQVPQGLLESGHGPVDRVWVHRPPEHLLGTTSEGVRLLICIAYQDSRSWGTRTYRDFSDVANSQYDGEWDELPAGLTGEFDRQKEGRLWDLLSRLVIGVVLAIANERDEDPKAYPERPTRLKHGVPKRNTVSVGKPLKIDCRPELRRYIQGHGTAREMTVSTVVRGHYRMQAHGPRWSQHKRIWVQPHTRGEGPLTIRPTYLGGPPNKE